MFAEIKSVSEASPRLFRVDSPSHEIVADYSYVHESTLNNLGDASESDLISANKEISHTYYSAQSMMERSSMPTNDAFAYHVALEIIYDDEVEPRSVAECQQRAD